jgi:formate hydrogenlyase subunit 3/multisubunit Na+/H+ antiporter MnhD subunit
VTPPRTLDRLAAGFLLLLLAIGSLTLWIGVPAGWLWLASKLTDSEATHFVAAIVGTPVAIVLFGWLLVWINRLYLRVRWASVPQPADYEDDEDEPRPMRGPLEPLLAASLVIALVALVVWFFVFAENPPRQFI